MAAAVERVATELGAPTILVNNAGILRDSMLFKMSDADWDAVIGVHLRGAFLMSRAVQAHQVAAKWGRIVNLSSTSALGNRGQANYSAAKAGLQGFTKTLAIELGPFGVTVNAIAPGIIATDMLRETAERIGMEFGDYLAEATKDVPMRACRHARGHRRSGVVLLLGGGIVRERAGALRGGRAQGVIARTVVGTALLMALAACTTPASPPATPVGTSEVAARAAHTATVLVDDTVLIAGGCVVDGCGDASADAFALTGTSAIRLPSMGEPRDVHSATLLESGEVLVTGGFSGEGVPPLASAEVFDPHAGSWHPVADLATQRGGHAAALSGIRPGGRGGRLGA